MLAAKDSFVVEMLTHLTVLLFFYTSMLFVYKYTVYIFLHNIVERVGRRLFALAGKF